MNAATNGTPRQSGTTMSPREASAGGAHRKQHREHLGILLLGIHARLDALLFGQCSLGLYVPEKPRLAAIAGFFTIARLVVPSPGRPARVPGLKKSLRSLLARPGVQTSLSRGRTSVIHPFSPTRHVVGFYPTICRVRCRVLGSTRHALPVDSQ